jgi:hypothetical protein
MSSILLTKRKLSNIYSGNSGTSVDSASSADSDNTNRSKSYRNLTSQSARNELLSIESIIIHPSNLDELHYLCKIGNLVKIIKFMDKLKINDQLNFINARNEKINCGNVLHTVLYYNTGTTAIELFDYFIRLGAEYIRNKNDQLPWEQNYKAYLNVKEIDEQMPRVFVTNGKPVLLTSFQMNGTFWYSSGIKHRVRDPTEFTDTYNLLIDTYELINVNVPKFNLTLHRSYDTHNVKGVSDSKSMYDSKSVESSRASTPSIFSHQNHYVNQDVYVDKQTYCDYLNDNR